MNKFVFLIHPRDTMDVARRFFAVRMMPIKLIDGVMARLTGRLGFSVCSHFFVDRGGTRAEGYIIAVALNGVQMMTLPPVLVRNRVLDAILYAQNKLKANVVGLGSLTTSVTDGGEWVIKQPGVKLAVTHGDTFTVAIACQGIENILQKFNFDATRSKVAIVGAYGLIGRELSVFLAKKGFGVILVESIPEKVELIKKRLAYEGLSQQVIAATSDIAAIVDADFIVTATSHHSYLLSAINLKEGAVVYDIAQPMNVGPAVARRRKDIVKIDGDYVDIGSIDLKFPMGPPKGSTFACLTETAMMALEGDKRNHVGSIDGTYLEETVMWGKKYGFSHAAFTSFGKPLRV